MANFNSCLLTPRFFAKGKILNIPRYMKCSCLGKALILCQRTSYINIEQSLPFFILHRHPLHNVMLVSKWNVCTFTSNEHFQKFYFWVEQVLFLQFKMKWLIKWCKYSGITKTGISNPNRIANLKRCLHVVI